MVTELDSQNNPPRVCVRETSSGNAGHSGGHYMYEEIGSGLQAEIEGESVYRNSDEDEMRYILYDMLENFMT